MARFLAVTSRGLSEPLAAELKELGFEKCRPRGDAVEVECLWNDLYRLHQSRLATRILKPLIEFIAYNEDDLYYGILRKHDFTSYIELNQNFRIEAHVRDHHKLRDQRFVAMKVKDAVADQFRNKFGGRPDVGREDDVDLKIVVRVVGPKVSVALDLTGEPLSNRGYRLETGLAPLRENVAAGMVRLSGWTPAQPLVDPFCGSGTILIEAALIATGRNPLLQKRRFLFERLKIFKDKSRPSFVPSEPSSVQPRLFGYDADAKVIAKARQNARNAGVEKQIIFEQRAVKDLAAPCVESGVLLTNPPYGERLDDVEKAKATFNEFSQTLKREFKNWDAWILSGNRESIQGLRLKATRRIPLWNGPIECRLLHYSIR